MYLLYTIIKYMYAAIYMIGTMIEIICNILTRLKKTHIIVNII